MYRRPVFSNCVLFCKVFWCSLVSFSSPGFFLFGLAAVCGFCFLAREALFRVKLCSQVACNLVPISCCYSFTSCCCLLLLLLAVLACHLVSPGVVAIVCSWCCCCPWSFFLSSYRLLWGSSFWLFCDFPCSGVIFLLVLVSPGEPCSGGPCFLLELLSSLLVLGLLLLPWRLAAC